MVTQPPASPMKFSDIAGGLVSLSDKLVQLAKDIPGVGTTRLNDLARRTQVLAKEAHDLGGMFYQMLKMQADTNATPKANQDKIAGEPLKPVESAPGVQPLDTSIGREKPKKS